MFRDGPCEWRTVRNGRDEPREWRTVRNDGDEPRDWRMVGKGRDGHVTGEWLQKERIDMQAAGTAECRDLRSAC